MSHYTFLLRCICGSLLLLCSTALSAQSWKTAKDKNGVKVETRFLSGWTIKEFRATIYVNTTLERAVQAFSDPAQRKKFMSNAEVSNLGQPSKDELITYYRGDSPWPVADRDNVSRSKFYRSAKEVKVTMEALPDYIPAKKGVVRILRSKGYWLFTDLGNGTIKIVQQSVADPGGNLPDWLVNSAVVDTPFDMMMGLKKLLE